MRLYPVRAGDGRHRRHREGGAVPARRRLYRRAHALHGRDGDDLAPAGDVPHDEVHRPFGIRRLHLRQTGAAAPGAGLPAQAPFRTGDHEGAAPRQGAARRAGPPAREPGDPARQGRQERPAAPPRRRAGIPLGQLWRGRARAVRLPPAGGRAHRLPDAPGRALPGAHGGKPGGPAARLRQPAHAPGRLGGGGPLRGVQAAAGRVHPVPQPVSAAPARLAGGGHRRLRRRHPVPAPLPAPDRDGRPLGRDRQLFRAQRGVSERHGRPGQAPHRRPGPGLHPELQPREPAQGPGAGRLAHAGGRAVPQRKEGGDRRLLRGAGPARGRC